MMIKLTSIALASAFALAMTTGVNAQVQDQAYKSPEDCVADYGRLDANGDGVIDKGESSSYAFIRQNVDVNGDGNISAEERTASCERGVAKAFRSPS
jgi:hypothetical protein